MNGGAGSGTGHPSPPPAPGPLAARRLSFANWPGYLDRDPADPGQHPTLAEFTRRTGIEVDYSEPITGNEQFFSSVGVPLAMGQSPGYDLVVLSDWQVAQFIGLGWARRLTPGACPHAAGLLPAFRDSPMADLLSYSLPWQGGLTGIGCNPAAAGRPVTSMLDLLTAADLRGRVALVADMRDVMGLILLEQGHDPADFSTAEFDVALEVLDSAVRCGQIRTVTNSYREPLARGDIAACVAWSGDLLDLRRQHPGLGFALPSGGMLWTDNMMILATAEHAAEAERLMDYYYEPPVAARLACSQLFICPVAGAGGSSGPAPAAGPYVFPAPGVLAAGHYFKRLTAVQNSVLTEKFSSTVGL